MNKLAKIKKPTILKKKDISKSIEYLCFYFCSLDNGFLEECVDKSFSPDHDALNPVKNLCARTCAKVLIIK